MRKLLTLLYRMTIGGLISGLAFVWRENVWPTIVGYAAVLTMLGLHGFIWIWIVALAGLPKFVALLAFITAILSATGIAATSASVLVHTVFTYAIQVVTRGFASRADAFTEPVNPKHALSPKSTGAEGE